MVWLSEDQTLSAEVPCSILSPHKSLLYFGLFNVKIQKHQKITTSERWCGGLMTRLSVQRFHVQIPVVVLVNFDLFKAKIQDENSKAPGDTC